MIFFSVDTMKCERVELELTFDAVFSPLQHVNISYCQDGGTWVSVAGKAEVSNDREKISKLYSPMLKGEFCEQSRRRFSLFSPPSRSSHLFL